MEEQNIFKETEQDIELVESSPIDESSLEQIKDLIREHKVRLKILDAFELSLGSPYRDQAAFKAAVAAEEIIRFEELSLAIHSLLPDAHLDPEKVLKEIEKLKGLKK